MYYVQGTIYIYTTAGKPVKEAKLIETKIGVISGLTLDPIKQVFKVSLYKIVQDHHNYFPSPGCVLVRLNKQGCAPLQLPGNRLWGDHNLTAHATVR